MLEDSISGMPGSAVSVYWALNFVVSPNLMITSAWPEKAKPVAFQDFCQVFVEAIHTPLTLGQTLKSLRYEKRWGVS